MTTIREQADAKKILGNEEFSKKNYEKSIECYTEAINLDPSNHLYFSNRSASYGALGKWAEAKADAKQCVALKPHFAKGFARLANAQRHLGQMTEAMESLKQGAKIDAGNGEINRVMRDMKKEAAGSGSMNQRPPMVLSPAVSKELEELQPQFRSVSRELEQISMKLQGCARDRKRFQLTRRDIATVPQDTTMYRSVGKMFLRMSYDNIEGHLKDEENTIDSQVASLESRKAYLERQKSSLEQNISELLSQCIQK